MNRNKLEKDLTELESEISSLEGADARTVVRLQELVTDIRAAMNASNTNDSGLPEPADNLRESIENFEADHPRVTGVLGRLTTLLSDMGI